MTTVDPRSSERIRAFLLVVLVLAASAGLLASTRTAGANVIAPLGAARVAGSHGSDWHDRQLLRNPTNRYLTGKIVLTERGTQTDLANDPALPYSIAPGRTVIIEDIYEQLRPGFAGAGTLTIVPAFGEPEPQWTPMVFNKDGDKEYGGIAPKFDPDEDGYQPHDAFLGATLSPTGWRDNPFIISGPTGCTVEFTYRESSGDNPIWITKTLAPQTTLQFTGGVEGMVGFEPEPGAQLEAHLMQGTARIYLSRNNNYTNDPAYDEMTVNPMSVMNQALMYVNYWLPKRDSRFFLSNLEFRTLVNGGMDTPGYARELAEILIKSPVAEGTSVEEMIAWLKMETDGIVESGSDDVYRGFDPFQWTPKGIRIYHEPSGGNVTDMPLSNEDSIDLYCLIKGLDRNGMPNNGFLIGFVAGNVAFYVPYNGSELDIKVPPPNPWNTQDPN